MPLGACATAVHPKFAWVIEQLLTHTLHSHAFCAGCMAALQAEHFITAHSASADAAASAPAEALPAANGTTANGTSAAAPAADGGHDAKTGADPGAKPGRTPLSAAQKAAIDQEADDTPMMAVL